MYYIAAQSTYSGIDIGLFKSKHLLGTATIEKKVASAAFIPTLMSLLDNHALTPQKLTFCAVNQGPAPFTTLRTLMASIQGLQAACSLPVVGIDGIDSLLEEYAAHEPNAVVLLNAYNNDLYFGIKTRLTGLQKGYQNIQTLLPWLANELQPNTLLFGNGITAHAQQIQDHLKHSQCVLQDALPSANSITFLGTYGLEKWHAQKATTTPVLPLYLKSYTLF